MNPAETSDRRNILYGDLHATQLREEKEQNEYSSRHILEFLFRFYRPASILDVGCGLGTWLNTAAKLGVSDLKGIDGEWLDTAHLDVAANLVQKCDLEKPFDLSRRFDLAICLEVAEHLSKDMADAFIASLTRHAPAVLFSAAIPHQGGHHHVNEQFPPYWVAKFAEHGFRPLDILRSEIWEDDRVLWWLRQNIMLFAHDDLIAGNAMLRAEGTPRGPLSLVHPFHYMRQTNNQKALLKLIGKSKHISINPIPNRDEQYTITDVSERIAEMTGVFELVRPGGLFQVLPDGAGGFTINRLSTDPDPAKFITAVSETAEPKRS